MQSLSLCCFTFRIQRHFMIGSPVASFIYIFHRVVACFCLIGRCTLDVIISCYVLTGLSPWRCSLTLPLIGSAAWRQRLIVSSYWSTNVTSEFHRHCLFVLQCIARTLSPLLIGSCVTSELHHHILLVHQFVTSRSFLPSHWSVRVFVPVTWMIPGSFSFFFIDCLWCLQVDNRE